MRMLDEEYASDEISPSYTLGRVGAHSVVIACLPCGQMGTNSAAVTATKVQYDFPSIRFGLMVGIGGGAPGSSAEFDVRLGDVVVSQPRSTHGGVVQYDFGKMGPGGMERTGFLNGPPRVLLSAMTKLQSRRHIGTSSLSKHLSAFEKIPRFSYYKAGPDVLFESEYHHVKGRATCDTCNRERQVARAQRPNQEPVVHHGTIASGNQVMRNGIDRDRISSELGGVHCFEMEAAGLMNSFPCLVIRGICDYADSHKNKKWQPYAAATAAAYAKELLLIIPTAEINMLPSLGSALSENQGWSILYFLALQRCSWANTRHFMYENILERSRLTAN